MRSPLAYAPRPGPVGGARAAIASLYLLSFAIAAFALSNPILLAGLAAGAVVAGLGAGAGRALALAARYAAALGALIVAVNALVSQRGETILVRGWELPVLGRLDVSAEALAEGGVLGLRIGVVLLASAAFSASVDPDRVLRLLRPVARRSALTAVLVARLVPLAVADQTRLREAASLRGPAAAPVGRAAMARRLLAGSLDRAVDVAATLELRGYGHGAPRSSARRPRSIDDRPLLAAGLGVLGTAALARVAGVGGFDAYPHVSFDAGAPTLALAAAMPALAALPLALAWRRRRVAGPTGRAGGGAGDRGRRLAASPAGGARG